MRAAGSIGVAALAGAGAGAPAAATVADVVTEGDRVDDGADFAEFVRVRGHDLRRLAFLLTGNQHDAEDLVQAALAKVLPRWRSIISRDDPYYYVRTVLVNTRRGWWRRDPGRTSPMAEVPELAFAIDAYAAHDNVDEMRRALDGLPPGQRKVVVLRYYEDLSEAEIARTLGCAPGTVKSQCARGLANLRELMLAARDEAAKGRDQ